MSRASGKSFDKGAPKNQSFDRGNPNNQSFDRGNPNNQSFDRGNPNNQSFDRGNTNNQSFDIGVPNHKSFDKGVPNRPTSSSETLFRRLSSSSQSQLDGTNENFEKASFASTFSSFLRMTASVLIVWTMGYLNFSIIWIILVAMLYSWMRRDREANQHRTMVGQAIAKDERSVIMASHDQLPHWVNFPDIERAEWINKILFQLWPFVSDYVEKLIHTFEPSIRDSLPSALSNSFHFSKVQMGDIAPRLSGIKVYPRLKRNEIYMDVVLDYYSDAVMEVTVSGVSAGIKDLHFLGTLRIVFKNITKELPLVGGIVVFFLESPDIDFELTSLARAFSIPGLNHMLKSAIRSQIASKMVLPHRLPVYVSPGQSIDKMSNPEPQGVIRLHVIEAKDLIKSDGPFGKSDPYVVVKLGMQVEKTHVVKKNLSPKWNTVFDLVVDLADGQTLFLDVYDEDIDDDDFLGGIDVKVSKVMRNSRVEDWIPLENIKSGQIHIKLTWLWLAPYEPSKRELTGNMALLLVFLDSASKLPRHKGVYNPHAQVTLVFEGERQKSSIVADTTEPEWQQSFRFFVRDISKTLKFEFGDTKTGKAIGDVEVPLSNILAQPKFNLERHRVIERADPQSKVFFRLSLRYLSADTPPKWARESRTFSVLSEDERRSVVL